MTVNELIYELTNLRDHGYGELEAKVAYQPSYPLEVSIDSVTGYNGHRKDEDGNDDTEKEDEACVYIATVHDNGYSTEKAWSGDIDELDEEDYTESED